jgi:hypothetical protein
MKNFALIVAFLTAATGALGCGTEGEKPADKPSAKPVPATAEAAKPGDSMATPEESPTLAADDEMPNGSTGAADGDSPTVPDDAVADKSEETADDKSEEPAGEPDPAEPAAPKTEGAVGSVALAREFEMDKAAAETKYKDKTILVEGKVGTYLAKDGYIYLEGSNDVRKVICILKAPTEEKIKFGDTVAVRGQFDLVAVLGVSLKGCELVKVNP